MEFPATFSVYPGNVGLGHPSMFQNPVVDVQLDKNPGKISDVDPSSMWLANTSYMAPNRGLNLPQYTVPYDPKDPPLNRQERRLLIQKFQPIADKTFTNNQPNLLYYLFFSAENVRTLQNGIRYAVNKWSGHHVGDQSLLELSRIMEEVFAKHANNIDENNAPSRYLFVHLRTETGRLNELVINEAVPLVIDAVEQHIAYMQQVDNPVSATSLQRPVDTNITGTTLYRSPTDILNPTG